jgi:hypothetical protein
MKKINNVINLSKVTKFYLVLINMYKKLKKQKDNWWKPNIGLMHMVDVN